MLNIWDVAVVVFLVVVIGNELRTLTLEIFRIVLITRSARRMKLRDKGTEGTWLHSTCDTTLRTGIDLSGNAHQYCWRCECFVTDDEDPDPKDREDLPDQTGGATERHDTNVEDLSKHRQRRKAA